MKLDCTCAVDQGDGNSFLWISSVLFLTELPRGSLDSDESRLMHGQFERDEWQTAVGRILDVETGV